ncbi:MAG: RNA-directed DNA polymerase [Caldilineaceae bacterium SB0664_bin_27]|uniref:RNA-directed DNA polymerase n=1 Tax=Caldilineaceae bacterium SB0664_bin_27 TaxID=2605260 RepID=A0A6B0YSK0_9CHLR|nr:RNA-directed DNA polymerase [Caldilineaceae bacterium SB0664_bin_27]
MAADHSDLPSRAIIQLSHKEAKEFLLKHESYLNFSLPPYFRFDDLISEVAKKLKKNFSFKKHCKSASRVERVNYTILNNKDGKLSWRPYELIHPVLYVSLVDQMTRKESWQEIVDRFTEFTSLPRISCLSLPVESLTTETDKAEQIKHWWMEVEQKSIELSLEYEFVVHTDLVDCYAAIYTHSIAWALHTREVAKENRTDMTLIGNVIDRHIQAMRNGQTNGIPQGSVLTDFIAEMVLGYADSELSCSIRKEGIEDYRILRYRDDYRIFVNNPLHGEIILRCLTKVVIELGLKLKSEKTKVSSEVIQTSIKDSKQDWVFRRTGDRLLQKQLLIIHDHCLKHPNSGSVRRALSEFGKRLERETKTDSPLPLISIVVDIAIRSPSAYPEAAAILSKLIELINNEGKERAIAVKVRDRFSALPHTGHMEMWLQRSTIKFAPDIEYCEPLCRLVCQESVPIWNDDWIDLKALKGVVDPAKIIDRKILREVGRVIQSEEIRIFDESYS